MQHPPKVKKTRPQKKAQRGRKWMFLSLALGLSLLFVLLLPQMKLWFPSEPFPALDKRDTTVTLGEGDRKGLFSITVTHGTEDAYTLLYQGKHLYLQMQEGTLAQISEGLEERLLAAATQLVMEDTVTQDAKEVQAHWADMGLSPPQVTARVRYQGGREELIELGFKAPETQLYYCRWSGDPGIYLCEQGVYQAFEYTAPMLLPVEQRQLQQGLIDRVSIQLRGREPLELQFTVSPQGQPTGMLVKPFRYPMATESVQALLTAAANFRLGTRQAGITPENEGQFGFASPLAVVDIHQQEGLYGEVDENGGLTPQTAPEQSLQLVLGQAVGEYFTTCLVAGQYYHVSNVLVAAFLGATPEGLITKNPANMGDAELASIQVQAEGRVLDLRRIKTERVLPNNQLATDESGNTLYDVETTFNGKSIPSETFDSLVERLKTLQVSGQVGADFVLGTRAPRWQLTLTTQAGLTRSLAAYPMDAFFDVLAVDGVIKHTLQGESLEMALAELR